MNRVKGYDYRVAGDGTTELTLRQWRYLVAQNEARGGKHKRLPDQSVIALGRDGRPVFEFYDRG